MIHQYAALPYRTDGEGKLEILLITSKERRRWVIPKGNPISSFRNYETAAREAFEEAGVEGGIAPEPVGSFRYMKRRRAGPDVPAMVTVSPSIRFALATQVIDPVAATDSSGTVICCTVVGVASQPGRLTRPGCTATVSPLTVETAHRPETACSVDVAVAHG